MSNRHTVSLDDEVYTLLKSKGMFGESFNSLINRLINTIGNDKLKEQREYVAPDVFGEH